jgi:hypothetical protein
MGSVLRRNDFRALMRAPAERRPFTSMKDALEIAGCDRNKLLLEWAALAEGSKAALGFSDKDGRHAGICLEFRAGSIERLHVLRPHSYSRELTVLVGDTLPPESISMVMSANDFAISFESYSFMRRDDTFRVLPWRVDENMSATGYSLEIMCRGPLLGGDCISVKNDPLDVFTLHAKAGPEGFYLLDLSR